MVTTTKPDWVVHTGEKKNKCTIYSISVHPDGTRLATGGQDNKVKIWSTLPILDPEDENNENSHRLLCTMSAHVGPVLTVRWAHHGRFLATGSDDKVVMIWNLDASGGGRLWGSDEVNVENWKPLKRLSAHDADVVDVAWSRDDSMLASVGLDSVVNIWSGYTFERLRTLSGHVGFVKGVTWDPVGEFLATQSDDKTVKVWNTQDWSVVNTISKPFERSPQSTFFRRLSWSPDGAFIAASNAMCGPVFVAAVIEREGWNSDISFIGHQNTIQVAAFNPRLFFGRGQEPGRATASTVLALGADDFNISIWRNTLHKPMMVLKDVFTRELHDLCWSNDGLVLYGCSADGSVCAIQFKPEELPELAEADATDIVLNEYDFKPSRERPIPLPPVDFGSAPTLEERVNQLVPRKGKAQRVGFSNGNGTYANGDAGGQSSRQPFGGARDVFAAAASSSYSHAGSDAMAEMLSNRHSAFANGDGGVNMLAARSMKRKATDGDDGHAPRSRSMGAAISDTQAQDIRAPRVSIQSSSDARTLSVPRVQTVLRTTQSETQSPGRLEAENAADDHGVNRVIFTRPGGDSWMYSSGTAALAVVATANFCASAHEDGTVKVYSVEGQQRATFQLPAPCHSLDGSKDMLLVVTADCLVRVMTSRAVVQPMSMSHLLDSTSVTRRTPVMLNSTVVRPNGCPVILTNAPAAYAFDNDLSAWTLIASPSLGPLPAQTPRTPAWIASDVEEAVAELIPPGAASPSKSLTSADAAARAIEAAATRCRAARLLDSRDEWLYWTKEHARVLVEHGQSAQVEEIVDELLGPIFSSAGTGKWEADVLGLPKRDVARIVLDVVVGLGRGDALERWAGGRLDLLDRAAAEAARWA